MSKHRKLGCNQAGVLEALHRHHYWHYGSEWTWGSRKQTKHLLETLAKRGLVYITVQVVPESTTGPSYNRLVYHVTYHANPVVVPSD